MGLSEETFEEPICEPPITEWCEAAAANRGVVSSAAATLGIADLEDLRNEAFEAARVWTGELARVAAEIGIPGAKIIGDSGGACAVQRMPLVFSAGHQPVIYHSGILYKNYLLSRVLRQTPGALGLNVGIDTDAGDGGEIFFIEAQLLPEPRPVIRAVSIRAASAQLTSAAGDEIFLTQRLADSNALREKFARIRRGLAATGHAAEAIRAAETGALYERLAGADLSLANTLLRRAYEGAPPYLDVPFSRMLLFPAVAAVLRGLLRDAGAVADLYDATLDRYRLDHKIKNLANPFPNLRREESYRELPFWVIDRRRGSREPLWFTPTESGLVYARGASKIALDLAPFAGTLACGDLLIAPRALLTTMLLRLLFSDLFVHGTGGAKYDQLTDRFIRSRLNLDAPRYATASASRYLFAPARAQYEAARDREARRREMTFHIDQHLDKFLPAEREELARLAAAKAVLVDKIRDGQLRRESVGAETRELKSLEQKIRAHVDRLLGPKDPAGEQPKHYVDLLYFRKFPFFFF